MKVANRVYALIVTLAGAALAMGCSSFTYAQPDAAAVVDAEDVSEVSDAVDVADTGPSDTITCAIEGQVFCTGTGCTNPRIDENNCGRCGQRCSRNNGTPSCIASKCEISCNQGYGDCDREVSTGCEVTFGTDSNHCGACGHACPTGGECRGGSCSCPMGQIGCAGACVDTMTNVNHCGACGNACQGARVCVAGACVCRPGWTVCGTTCVKLSSDPMNCGGCDMHCVTGATCIGGICPLTTQRSCGVAGTPGCGLVRIEGGTFTQGGDVTDNGGQTAMPGVSVSSFVLDAYEVTVARYRAWWRARDPVFSTIRSLPIVYPSGQTITLRPESNAPMEAPGVNWTDSPVSSTDAHPMNYVNWWAAQEFCVWDGGRLPTEAEWEYAARGRTAGALREGRTYPWGDGDPPTNCVRLAHWNRCTGTDGRSTRRVGSFDPSGGVYDLSGNVFEWTADNATGYPLSADCHTSSINPLCLRNDIAASHSRTFRGGSFVTTGLSYLHSTARSFISSSDPGPQVGFRCARPLP